MLIIADYVFAYACQYLIQERYMMTEQRFVSSEEAREVFATKADIAQVETSVAQLETRMAQMETRLIKWMVGSQLGFVIAIAAVMRLLS